MCVGVCVWGGGGCDYIEFIQISRVVSYPNNYYVMTPNTKFIAIHASDTVFK